MKKNFRSAASGKSCAVPDQNFSRAFTLIEMLVVVAIIGILAALLLSTLSKAKARGLRAACINNERQLIATWLLYAGDNNDNVADNGMPDAGGNPNKKFWIQGVFFNAADNSNPSLMFDPKYAEFAPYLRTAKTYVCPSDRRSMTIAGKYVPKLRSYSMNSYIGWKGELDDRLSTNYIFFRKTTQMVKPGPSLLFVFSDVHPSSICWPYFGVYMNTSVPDRFFNFPAVHHSQGGVIAFGDGHVEQHRWMDPRTIKAYSPSYHDHSDTSANNQDIAWLRNHASWKK